MAWTNSGGVFITTLKFAAMGMTLALALGPRTGYADGAPLPDSSKNSGATAPVDTPPVEIHEQIDADATGPATPEEAPPGPSDPDEFETDEAPFEEPDTEAPVIADETVSLPPEESEPVVKPEVIPSSSMTAPPPIETEPVVDPPLPTVQAKPLRPRPRHAWIYNNLSGLRNNPQGLVNDFATGYRYLLSKNVDSALLKDSYVAAQLHAYLTPAYARIGPRVSVQPVAMLNLSATYDFTGYYGSFGLFQSFRSPTEEWSDTELGRRDASGDPAIDNYSTTGHHVTLSALLQAKVKHIAVRDNLQFYWANFNLREGDTVYYHQTLDILQPNRGWSLTNDADLLYLFDFGLTAGVRYSVTHAFYRAEDFQPSEPVVRRPNGPTHRVGPALLYTFFDRPDLRFNNPTIILLLQFWAKHRYRTGQDVSAASPYLVLGFSFKGEILPDPASWHEKTTPKRRRGRRARSRI